MLTDPLFYLVAVPVIFVHGVSKGGFGGVFGVTTVPILSLVVTVPEALAITLPIFCAMDIYGVWAYRRSWDRAALQVLLPAGLVGLGVGLYLLTTVDEASLRIGIALFTLANVVMRLQPRRVPKANAVASPADAAFWGTFAGAASFIAHAGSAVLSIHLLKRRLPPAVTVGTTIAFTAVLNHVSVPAFASIGELDAETLATAVLLLPLAPIGVYAGMRIAHHIPRARFERITLVLLAAAGTALLARGLAII